MSFPSTHPLGIDDHTDVYEAFEGISAKWDFLAIRLCVGRNAVEKIQSDHSGAERRLSAVLDEWLRKKLTGSARVPSWKWLCEGVGKIDRGLAEAVIRQHQCGCVQCSGVSLPLKRSLEPPEQERYDTLLVDAVKNKNFERIRQSVESGGNPFSHIPGTSNTIFSFAAENKQVFECLKSVYVHHHHTGDHAVDILYPHYDEIYSRLGNPLDVLDMLHRESVISKTVLLQATPERRDLRELLITTIEQAVKSNHHNLQAVALIFKKYDCLFDIGDTLLKAFNQVFDIPYDLVPLAEKSTDTFRIREFYRSEFGKFFGKRALLYDKVRKIMKRKLSLKRLTKFLLLYNRDLKSEIKRCKSIRDVIDVMRNSTSITDTSLLETVAIRFTLDEVLKLLENYSRELGEFCNSIKVKHAYGMKFMECYQHGLLTSDKAKFVLEWEPGEETIADIRSMLSYAFYDFANNISIVVVDKDNSIAVICSVPTHLHGVFIEMVNQNGPALENAKVLSITLGMCVLFKRKEEDKNVLPAKKTFEEKEFEGEKEQKDKMAMENEEVVGNLQSRIRSLENQLSLERQMKGEVSTGFDESQAASLETMLEVERELRKKMAIDLEQTQAQLKEHLKPKEPPVQQYKENDEKILQIKNALSERNKVIKTLREEVKRLHQRVKVLTPKPQVSSEEQRKWNEKLLNAAERGVVKDVKDALSHGAKTECTDSWYQRTPLHIASRDGHVETVKLLLTQGVEIDSEDVYWWTPLHYASRDGHVEIVKLLLTQGTEIYSKNKYWWTPLHCASRSGHVEVVKLLLTQGAEIDSKDKSQQTPLHCASGSGHVEVVELLLTQGAEIDSKDKVQWTPLHCASRSGHVEVVKLLLTKGAEIDSKSVDQWTPLHIASSYGHVEAVKLLLTQGAKIDSKDGNGQSPLHWALLENHPNVAVVLISSGADIHKEDKWGQSTVLIASVFDYQKIMKHLLSQVSSDTIQKYHLPQGWKAGKLWSSVGYRIEYTNMNTGTKQYDHPNFSKS